MEEKMFFGKKLKELRLKSNIGLRKFAEKIEILPSELSDIEHGYKKLEDSEVFDAMKKNFVWPVNDLDIVNLEILLQEPFAMQKMSVGGIPVFPITTDGKPITDEKLRDLHEYLQTYMEEHNTKADIYNKRHGVS